MRRWVWLGLLCSLVGCGSTVDEGGSGGSGAGGAAADSCPKSGSCRSTSCNRPTVGTECTFEFSCSLADACTQLRFERDPATQMLTLVNPGDANCLLEGLRDGLEGRYHWSVDGGNGGQFGSSTFIDLRPNRVALVTHVSNFDLSQSRSYNGPTSLQDAGYFTQCLTQTEPANILDCLDAATLACGG